MSVRCAHCSTRDNPVNHDTVEQVRQCAADELEGHAQQQAELAAEARAERYYEEGPESFQLSRWADEQEEIARIGYTNAMSPDGPLLSDEEETRLIQAAEREEDERVAEYKALRDSEGLPHPDVPGLTHAGLARLEAEHDAAIEQEFVEAAAPGLALLERELGPAAVDEVVEEASPTADNPNACEGGVCSWHDRCHKHRAEHAAGASTQNEYIRRMFRAYND